MDAKSTVDDRLEECRRLRGILLKRLWDIDGPFFNRLQKCGEKLYLVCDGCLNSRLVLTACKWKSCPVCQRATTAATASRYRKIAAKCQWPLLATFSCAHKKEDGVENFRRMRKAWSKLRRQVWFLRRVSGGVACWEVSRLNKAERNRKKLGKDRGWHFHVHVLMDCKWLYVTTPPPRHDATKEEKRKRIAAIIREVEQVWSDLLDRKGKVNVRRVWKAEGGGIDGAVHEVCKYAMTGAALAQSEYDIEPVLWALEKTRMICGFGSFAACPDIKRERHAPAMCECGCSAWVPEQFHEATRR